MNNPVTKITIPTARLRELLPEEAMVEIERVAIEKIGEEVRRKIADKKLDIQGTVRAAVSAMVQKDLTDETNKLGVAWRFPNAGKGVVEKIVKDAVETTLRNIVVDAVIAVERKMGERLEHYLKDAERRVNDTAQHAVSVRMAELDRRIAERSRAEFLAVLKEAKEAGL